jgi:hypothetical protein
MNSHIKVAFILLVEEYELAIPLLDYLHSLSEILRLRYFSYHINITRFNFYLLPF